MYTAFKEIFLSSVCLKNAQSELANPGSSLRLVTNADKLSTPGMRLTSKEVDSIIQLAIGTEKSTLRNCSV